MAQSDDKRRKLLYILAYLMEHTDEEHSVKNADIIEHLQNAYNIPVERKTISTDIKLLQDFGADVGFEIKYDAAAKGYKVVQREFELDELQLLIDSAFYGIDNIHAAIAEDRKISFRYFNYNVKKEKEYNKKTYIVSPYALLWNEGNYYLVAFENGRMKHFRVDKMDTVKRLDEKRDGKEAFNALHLSERSSKVFSMYGGTEERIVLRFSNHLTGVVIDRFGKDIMMIPDGGKHFTVTVNIEVSPQFFGWLCGLGRGVKILAPTSVVEQMKKHVEGIAGMCLPDT